MTRYPWNIQQPIEASGALIRVSFNDFEVKNR